jgi:hypothetical protein
MSKDFTISLDSILNSKIEETVQTDILTESKITPVVEEAVSVDIDAILTEWAWRCEKGYPNYNDKNDMIKLQEVLDEMGITLPFNRIKEANPKKKTAAPVKKAAASKTASVKSHPIFNKEYLDRLYPKHSRAIMDAYRTHGKSSKNLNKFGKANSLDELLATIGNNISDPLFKALYTISSVSGKEGEEAQTSGRGGLGKGEVLCVLLTKGGKSGGTAGTDLDSESGNVSSEVKAGDASSFKVPMAAERIKRFQSQTELRKLYSLVESVKDTDEWPKFLAIIQKELGKDAMVLDDGVYFGKKPTPSNINQTEYSNIRKFFKGCNSYFFKSKNKTDDSLYIDIDSPTGDDALLQAKLKTPKSVAAIKPNSKVEIDVVTKDVDAIRVFKMFEYRLKQHPFVAKVNEFDNTARRDLRILLKNKYIIFHEKPKGSLSKPILIDDVGGPHDAQIVSYTLDQVVIKFKS